MPVSKKCPRKSVANQVVALGRRYTSHWTYIIKESCFLPSGIFLGTKSSKHLLYGAFLSLVLALQEIQVLSVIWLCLSRGQTIPFANEQLDVRSLQFFGPYYLRQKLSLLQIQLFLWPDADVRLELSSNGQALICHMVSVISQVFVTRSVSEFSN